MPEPKSTRNVGAYLIQWSNADGDPYSKIVTTTADAETEIRELIENGIRAENIDLFRRVPWTSSVTATVLGVSEDRKK